MLKIWDKQKLVWDSTSLTPEDHDTRDSYYGCSFFGWELVGQVRTHEIEFLKSVLDIAFAKPVQMIQ